MERRRVQKWHATADASGYLCLWRRVTPKEHRRLLFPKSPLTTSCDQLNLLATVREHLTLLTSALQNGAF